MFLHYVHVIPLQSLQTIMPPDEHWGLYIKINIIIILLFRFTVMTQGIPICNSCPLIDNDRLIIVS